MESISFWFKQAGFGFQGLKKCGRITKACKKNR
jgi:hypothetical protein